VDRSLPCRVEEQRSRGPRVAIGERRVYESVCTNFLELRKTEVQLPRISILGTSVNKGKEKGRGCYTPACVLCVSLSVRRVH
jgi:hypothetical protein